MKNIKWTSSPWGFRQESLADQLKFFESLGISDICMQCQCGPDMPGLFPSELNADELDSIAAQLKAAGVSLASFNGDGDYMAYDVDAEIATTMRRLEIAARLGAKTLIVFAGWQDVYTPAIYDQVSVAIKTVAQEAARHNIIVALENHGGLTTTIEQCNRILAGVGESNVGLNYDPANFLMYGQCPLDAFDRLEHRIVFTHLKSLKINADASREYCRLDDGEIDYRPILERLLDNYDGLYGLEYEEPLDVFEGSTADFIHLKNLIDEINGVGK